MTNHGENSVRPPIPAFHGGGNPPAGEGFQSQAGEPLSLSANPAVNPVPEYQQYSERASAIVKMLSNDEYAYLREVTNHRLAAIIAKRVAKHAHADLSPATCQADADGECSAHPNCPLQFAACRPPAA